MDFNDYAAKSMSEKWELRKKDASIVVDIKRYDEVLKFQTGESVVKKIRENIEHAQMVTKKVNHCQIRYVPTVEGRVNVK